MRQEKQFFESALKRVSLYWEFGGILINYNNKRGNQSKLNYLLEHWFYVLSFVFLNLGILSFLGSLSLLSTEDIVYMVPCVAICFLGDVKSYYVLYYEDKIYDVINTLRTLQSIDQSEGKDDVDNKFVKKHLPFLAKANRFVIFISSLGIATFLIGPVIISILQYFATNEVRLFLPYKIQYPFNENKFKGWIFAFFHQFWSAWSAVFYILGPDCFFNTACAFVHSQFLSLIHDVERISINSFRRPGPFEMKPIEAIIHRHRELVRCVDLLNVIYGKSTLFNVLSSSFIICFAGFNIKSIQNLIMIMPFIAVMFFGSIQVFLMCYYGDVIMRASIDVSVAVFNSPQWYMLDNDSMKCCLFILRRAQKPCTITAFGFRDINLKTFSKILTSAWSYFTLLNTMYTT